MKLVPILLFLNSLVSMAQPAGSLRFQRLSIEHGLPDAFITCLEQDADGFLWIGTANGLSRYDGAEFKNFFHHTTSNSLPGNHVIAMQNYDSCHLLIATNTGLSLLNVRTLRFKNLIVSAPPFMFNLENYFTTVAIDAQKNIWAGTKTTLYYLDPQFRILRQFRGFDEKDYNLRRMHFVSLMATLPGNELIAHLQDKPWDGSYFIVDPVKGIRRLKNFSMHPLKRLGEVNILSFFMNDKSGFYYYIKNVTDSLFHYRWSNGEIEYIPLHINNFLQKNTLVNARMEKLDETTFVMYSQQGGFVLVPASPHSATPGSLELRNQVISMVRKDREGNLWVASRDGLFKSVATSKNIATAFLNPVAYTPEIPAGLRKLFFIGDEIWVSSNSSGFYRIKSGLHSIKNISFNAERYLNTTWGTFKINEDTLWLSTQEGLRWYSMKSGATGKLLYPHPDILDKQPITALMKHREGIIWIGVGFGNGLIRFNPHDRSFKHYSAISAGNPLPIRYPIAIAEDYEGNVWMGNHDGTGLVRWIKATDKFEIITPRYKETFDNAHINAIYCDKKEKVWIGTYNGLFSYHIPTQKFKRFDVSSGLLSPYINSISSDGEGRLWIGSNYGISCYIKEHNRFYNYTQLDAVPESQVSDIVYDTISKKIYFTTNRYIGSFDPDSLLSLQSSLNIKITGVQVGKNQQVPGKKYSVDYNENEVSVFFTAINLTDGHRNKYFYRVNEREWISTGEQRNVHFTNLTPGNYKVDLMATNSSGKESVYPGALSFVVRPPFWQTWWFYAACASILTLLLYGLYRYRINQLIMWQKARDRIATDLHDDIGSTLTNISILSQLSHKNLDKPAEAGRFLQRISDEVHNSSQAMDDIIWSVNSRNDSLEETMARMRRYAADLFDNTAVKAHLDLEENSVGKKLGMQQRRDIYLIYKESLNNICKHAAAKNVWISARQEHDTMKLIIKDDGRGFHIELPTHRNGLKNLHERVAKWNGKIRINSDPGRGTCIEVDMPVGS